MNQQQPDVGPPVTGDAVVDQALRDLEAVAGHGLRERVQAAGEAHRLLQERLRQPETAGEGDGAGDGGRPA